MPNPGDRCLSPAQRIDWLGPIILTASVTAIRVAYYLASCCNGETRRCDPSVSTIARDIGMNPSNVSRALKELRGMGVIEEEDSNHRSRQWRLIYRFCGCPQRNGKVVSSATKGLSPAQPNTVKNTVTEHGAERTPQKGARSSATESESYVGSQCEGDSTRSPFEGAAADPHTDARIIYENGRARITARRNER